MAILLMLHFLSPLKKKASDFDVLRNFPCLDTDDFEKRIYKIDHEVPTYYNLFFSKYVMVNFGLTKYVDCETSK